MRATKQSPAIQLTFHGLKPSEELKREVSDRIAWLEQFYTPLLACRVRLQVPHRHHSHGRHMHVTIEMAVPRHPPLVITYEPSIDDARVAVREAFDVARRRLQDLNGAAASARSRRSGSPRLPRSEEPSIENDVARKGGRTEQESAGRR
jgi:hypothetical protein